MSEFSVPDPEKMVVCPYDEVHLVAHKRMQYHLVKCRRNHDTTEKATCPFNRRHEVPKLELRYHMMFCVDKVYIESDFYQTEANSIHGNLSTPPYEVEPFIVKPKETWESEGCVLPELEEDELKEFRNLTGLKPAERRLYKQKLREKFEMEQNGEEKNVNDNTNKLKNGLQPLRRPNTTSVAEKMLPPPGVGIGRGCFRYSDDVINSLHNNSSDKIVNHLQNGFSNEHHNPDSPLAFGRGIGIGRGSTSFFNYIKSAPSTSLNKFDFSDQQMCTYDYEVEPRFQNLEPLPPGKVADIDRKKFENCDEEMVEEFSQLKMK